MKLPISVLFAVLVFGASPSVFADDVADGQTDDVLTDLPADRTVPAAQLIQVLGWIDIIPTREQLTSVGVDDDGAALRGIALDALQSQYVRVRAVHMLALFDSTQNQAFVRDLAHQTDTPLEVRIAAVYVGTTSAIGEPAEVDTFVVEIGTTSVDELRLAAIRAATRFESVRAQALLSSIEEQVTLSSDQRAALDRAIETVRSRP